MRFYTFTIMLEGNIVQRYTKKLNMYNLQMELLKLNSQYNYGDYSIRYSEN